MSSFSVFTTDFVAEEGRGTGAFVIKRDGDLTEQAVCYVSLSGSAEEGIDYQLINHELVFASGCDSVTLLINPVNDGAIEGDERVVVQIEDRSTLPVGVAEASITVKDPFSSKNFLVDPSETFHLSSKPDSSKTIYLNFFGGDYYENGYVSPYDIDGDPSDLSLTELSQIQSIWSAVAEDFLPFDINVTTQLPADGVLEKEGDADDQYGVSILIGGEPGDYGFAWSGSSFTSASNQPGYVSIYSNENDYFYPLDTVASAVSHELGHTFGLTHDGPGQSGYYPGHEVPEGYWLSLMGVGTSGISQWSKGEYASATNLEDDIAIITNAENGVRYRVDDHADDYVYSTELVELDDGFGTLYAEGVIEQSSDVDWFSLSHDGGRLVLNIEPVAFSPNLKVGAYLYDAFNQRVIEGDNLNALSSQIFINDLDQGHYFLRVEGVGSSDGVGFSDYGSLGGYSVSSGVGLIAAYDPDGQYATEVISGLSQFDDVVLSTLSAVSLGVSSTDDAWALKWDASPQIDLDEYLAFAVAPELNSRLSLSSLALSMYSFADDDTVFLLRSSVDNFVSTIDEDTLNPQMPMSLAFDMSELPLLESEVEFRVYATSDSGEVGYRYLTGSAFAYDDQSIGIELSGRVLPSDPTDLSGHIYLWNTHQLLPGIETFLVDDNSRSFLTKTDLAGKFQIDVINADQTIEFAFNDGDFQPVVTAADALAGLKIAVGLNPNPGNPLSPYQFLAADMNQDGRVSAADALAILKSAVKIYDAVSPELCFVPEAIDFESILDNKWHYENLRSSGAPGDLNQIAYVLGDVNASWQPSSSAILQSAYFEGLEQSGVGATDFWWV